MQTPKSIERTRLAGGGWGRYVWTDPVRTHPLPDQHGPWSVPPTPPSANKPRQRPSRGLLIWLGLVAAGVAAYAALMLLFPGQLDSMDQTNALQALGFLALVSSGLVYARRMQLGEVARNAAIWVGVAAVALLGYSFKDEFTATFAKLRGELIPAYAVSTAPHTMTVTASEDGGFYIMGAVNGTTVRFVIDTGANGVLLSPADAKRAGIDVEGLKFGSPAETANGVGYTAPVTLSSLDVGAMRLRGVPAAVNREAMSSSLLGMAFLGRLDSFEFRGDQLTLKWKGPTPVPAQAPPAPAHASAPTA